MQQNSDIRFNAIICLFLKAIKSHTAEEALFFAPAGSSAFGQWKRVPSNMFFNFFQFSDTRLQYTFAV
jgi:hypothetical protein